MENFVGQVGANALNRNAACCKVVGQIEARFPVLSAALSSLLDRTKGLEIGQCFHSKLSQAKTTMGQFSPSLWHFAGIPPAKVINRFRFPVDNLGRQR